MSKFIIQGGKTLGGEVLVPGNKNEILPVMAATLLTKEDCVIENVPLINDVLVMGEILKDLGAKVEGLGTNRLVINTSSVTKYNLNPDLVKKLRASILFLGPLLARFGKASLRHPGGCILGRRAVGTHFDALEALGARIATDGGDYYDAQIENPRATEFFLDEASVTATENTMMLAALIPGKTVIRDAASEPSVEALANFLNAMGAKISGGGTNTLTIEGVENLKGATHKISPDYIDAGTFAILAAATNSQISISPIKEQDLSMVLLYLKRSGVNFEIKGDELTVYPSKIVSPNGKIQTRTWPGFPTDLMSPFIVLMTQTEGLTLCHDWMYESRMFFVDKLITMGAKITICDPYRVLVNGPASLKGRQLTSPDLRAGMALIVAALCAEGESVIDNIEMVERGYENIEERLRSLGADIKRVA